MSPIVERRKRLLRLRSIEHRMAAAKAVEADGALANLHSVSGRISALRGQLVVGAGPVSGLALKAMCEMSTRLDAAQTGLVQPIRDAEGDVAHKRALRIRANQKEESAAKLTSRATTAEIKAREVRTDANRPFRRRTPSGEIE